ncbi:MAG: 2-hydroxyglutaryl-CoA dehydratase [Deltaproteobacteria bacterium]|nr:2-hydroxyglutaryl-CoA dehydratase [Deltaproteobacteria bacterium]
MSAVAGIGIDAGSTTTKLVAVDGGGAIVAHAIEAAHPRVEDQVARLLDELRARAGAGVGVPSVATGYGRKLVKEVTRQVTEITCHARGVFAALGTPGTLVDIGGQDSKVIRVGADGRAVDFLMNDKCAAGTGRFLENTASRLGVPLDELGPRAIGARGEEAISSTCTVFAESEIISLIAHGAELGSILKGLHRSLIGRIGAMVRGVGLERPLMLSGGVARNVAVRELLGELAGEPVVVPEDPQLMGAYGAAILALESSEGRFQAPTRRE